MYQHHVSCYDIILYNVMFIFITLYSRSNIKEKRYE